MTLALALRSAPVPASPSTSVLTAFVESEGGEHRLSLLVDGVHCGRCIHKIENRLKADPSVVEARVNLSLRRLTIRWKGKPDDAERIGAAVEALGYGVAPYEVGQLTASDQRAGRELLRSLAIAAFASSNVMMLSWAVWAGQAQEMPLATQALFHWLSAIVAVPTLIFAGRPFYRSAFRTLRSGRTNIDVPIVAGLVLTAAISMFELLRGGPDVYFDSAAMLMFVLLIGRYLDFRVRARSRAAVEQLVMMKADHATVLHGDGRLEVLPANAVLPGMLLVVAPGEAMPVDGSITDGHSSIDVSIVTGETLPFQAGPRDAVLAGSVNGAGALRIRATRTVNTSHLAEILRLVEQAELQRGPAATLADRVARIWTPVVHGIALLTFLGWWLVAGVSVPLALLYAVSVLIIACPCAIGLAVPTVQVVAIGALLKKGILIKSGDALERLAIIDQVAFDKTGTLSKGRPVVTDAPSDPAAIGLAIRLAAASQHQLARALIERFGPPAEPLGTVVEHGGSGLEAEIDGVRVRLGSALFCDLAPSIGGSETEVWLAREQAQPARFTFDDVPRSDAQAVIEYCVKQGLAPAILSGDRAAVVDPFSSSLGITDRHAGLLPAEKVRLLEDWRARGRHTLMVGDGLNDAPALANAHVSASFGHGAAASQIAADIILPADRLSTIVLTHKTARKAARIIWQNLGFAAAYNAVLIPLAVLGHATPIIAALAMSASSMVVTLNALRARPPREGAT